MELRRIIPLYLIFQSLMISILLLLSSAFILEIYLNGRCVPSKVDPICPTSSDDNMYKLAIAFGMTAAIIQILICLAHAIKREDNRVKFIWIGVHIGVFALTMTAFILVRHRYDLSSGSSLRFNSQFKTMAYEVMCIIDWCFCFLAVVIHLIISRVSKSEFV